MKITVTQQHAPQTVTVVRQGPAGPAGINGTGADGTDGTNGWSPVFSAIVYGLKVVWQLSDWVGGTGTKPATGYYLGSTGFVASIVDAVDMRGATGLDGVTPTFSISTVSTLPEGSPATVTDTGTPGNIILEFGLPAGPTGATGATGADGVDGADGAQGDPGPAGADGADGESAYEIAVNAGFIGDEVAWLASLVGPQGDPGPAGADGAPGADGAQGDPGPTGDDGASAYEVAVANGFVGDEAAWLASLVGATGATGPQGPTGATGPAGATGATGAPGTAATIAVGTVTTGAAGSSAVITNSGSSSAAVFDFTIPRGDTGASGSSTVTISGKTGAYTVVAGDLGAVINCTANTFTVSLTAAATLGAGFHCWIWNTSGTTTHTITIDPNGAETIDGTTTLILRRGEGCQIICDGTNWQTGGTKKQRLYSENAIVSVTRPVASGGNSVAIGSGATATVTSAVAMGETATATGTNAVALGKARATTTDSFAASISDSTTTYGAKTSPNAVAIGYFAIASGQFSAVVGGSSCLASATGAITLGGSASSATGSYSGVLSGYGGQATGSYSAVIGGYNVSVSVHGKVASGVAGNVSGTVGAAQSGTLTLVRNTANNTPTVLTSDNLTPGASNQLVLSNNQSMAVTGRVIAQRKGSESTTSTAAWEFKGVIRRGANAASTALVAAVTPTLIAADADAAAWTIAVTADTTNGALAVTVTGETSKNIRWVCTLESTETIYA